MFLRSQGVSQYKQVAKSLAHAALDQCQLSDQDRVMLDYARKLTLTPAEMTDDDTARLHEAGFSDAQVWEITFTTSIFAMFNRMADAFGLEPPAETVRALYRD